VRIFFFSSRRRHTRWPRDWSSDVCSSDLLAGARQILLVEELPVLPNGRQDRVLDEAPQLVAERRRGIAQRRRVQGRSIEPLVERSEERRVGKECRSRW